MGKRLFFLSAIILTVTLNSFSMAVGDTYPRSLENHEISGEIEAIASDTVRVRFDGITKEYPFASGVQIFCNGVKATWKSLLPITSEAFFEATISLDVTNHVILLDGYYQGEECMIEGWFYDDGQLNLQFHPMEKIEICCKAVNKGAKLPKANWLHIGQLVFIVYNKVGEIRGVYLPD